MSKKILSDKNSEASSSLKNRVSWIDTAKGICILAIIAGHLGEEHVEAFVFAFHLTTFFILSGYTLKRDKFCLGFINASCRRLMKPYFITAALLALINQWNAITIKHIYNINELSAILWRDLKITFAASGSNTTILGTEMGGRIGAIWFFPALFFARILAAYLIKRIERREVRVAVASVLFLLGWYSAQISWFPFSIQPALMATPFVIIGFEMKASLLMERLKDNPILFLLPLTVLLSILVYGKVADIAHIVGMHFASCNMADPVLTPIASVMASILLLGLSMYISRCNVINWLGRNSLVIMCAHLIALNSLYWYITRLIPASILDDTVTGFLALLVFHIVFSLLACVLINAVKRFKVKKNEQVKYPDSQRDSGIDVLKAVLILLMLYGHYVDGNSDIRPWIYSFHMMAFVIMSGYFYHSSRTRSGKMLRDRILRMGKTILLPYLLFSIVYMAIKPGTLTIKLKTVLLGMSFSKQIFPGVPSIGPVYFVLMLFCVRVLYLLIDTGLKSRRGKAVIVLCAGIVGTGLGALGIWLPWSLDCALYALMLYYIGIQLRRWNVLQYVTDQPWIWFLLTAGWAISIRKGSMELAIRNYGFWGTAILGAVCGTIVVYMFCMAVKTYSRGMLVCVLAYVGESTFYILIVHTLFRADIQRFLLEKTGWSKGNTAGIVLLIMIQTLAGVGVRYLGDKMKISHKK